MGALRRKMVILRVHRIGNGRSRGKFIIFPRNAVGS